MSHQPRLLFFAGSIRSQSLNAQLVRLAASMARSRGADVTLVDLADYPMPLYNGDVEAADGLPETARALKALFHEHGGFFIASPEYNSSLSPLLKNTLDWVSRRETADEPALSAYSGKVAALGAASRGRLGGLRGLVPLRMMLANIGVHVVPAQLAVPNAGEAFDADGNLRDDTQTRSLGTVLDQLIRTTRQLAP